MKIKNSSIIWILLLLCVVLAVFFKACADKEDTLHREAMVFSNVLFIGDSLTEGGYWYYDEAGERNCCITEKTLPYFFCQISGARGQNEGYSGIDAEEWYKERSLESYADYDLVIIWLGTNDGYSVEKFESGVKPFKDYNEYSDDPTGYYCRIIASVKESNPRAHVVLCNIYCGGYANDETMDGTNEAIKHISEYYGCQFCDMTWLKLEEGSEYHAEIDNIHLGVYGNLRAAEYLYDEISQTVRDDYTIAEKMFVFNRSE